MQYSEFRHLLFERHDRKVMLVTLNRPDTLNSANARMHWELTKVWDVLREDDEVNVIVVTGAGKAFSSGGDIAWVEKMVGNPDEVAKAQKEAADLVYGILRCEKPIISAINGVAVGAGLVVALMADISIMSDQARFTDGHVRLGVGAGDFAAIMWPLLCGITKSKYYLMTADFIDGPEAERMGMVTRCVPHEKVLEEAFSVANGLAEGAQGAIRGTKQVLNGWIRMASPIFENSLRMEMQGFLTEDAREGARAFREKRKPRFPSAQ